jgi:redox-sensing transcriptional repressor
MATIDEANAQIGARLGIVAVPAWEAQNVADRLVQAGVHGIINFAPVRLCVPNGVRVRDVCFICELTVLSYLVQQEAGDPPADLPAPIPPPTPESDASEA